MSNLFARGAAIFGRLAIGLTVLTATTGCLALGLWRPIPGFFGLLAIGVGVTVSTCGTPDTGARTSGSTVELTMASGITARALLVDDGSTACSLITLLFGTSTRWSSTTPTSTAR